jgi:hypothetical protein
VTTQPATLTTLTTLPPCASCDPARCAHAQTWWCADCDRWESCGDTCFTLPVLRSGVGTTTHLEPKLDGEER